MKTMSEYWDYRSEVATAALVYAAYQAGKCVVSELLLRGFEQMSLPIETAEDTDDI